MDLMRKFAIAKIYYIFFKLAMLMKILDVSMTLLIYLVYNSLRGLASTKSKNFNFNVLNFKVLHTLDIICTLHFTL